MSALFRSRRHAAIIGSALAGIVGLTLLRPHVPGNILERKYVTADVAFDGHDTEILIDTPYMHYSTDNQVEDQAPQAAGWYVVWQRLLDNGWQIILYDAKTNKEMLLTDEKGDHLDPQTDGRYVVWRARDGGAWNIYVYDTQSPQDGVRQLSQGGNAMHARISKGTVVWQQWINKNWEIVAMIIGQKFVQLTDNAVPDIEPDVFHSLVVWEEVMPGPLTRIRVHDLRSGKEEDLIAGTDGQIRPNFSDDGKLSWYNYGDSAYSLVSYDFLTDNENEQVIAERAGAQAASSTPETTSSTEPVAPPASEATTTAPTSTEPAPAEATTTATTPPTSTEPAASETSSTTPPAPEATTTEPPPPAPAPTPTTTPDTSTTGTVSSTSTP